MEILKKYPKSIQWAFLLIVFFTLCFSIDVPEGYKFIRAQAEHVKDPNQVTYNFLGTEVRYIEYSALWRLPPLLAWLPIWVNDSMFFLLNDWMPIEIYDAEIDEYETRPLVLQITRMISASMLFLIQAFREILIGGVETVVAFTSWDWIDANPWAELPGLPWTIVAAAAIILGYKLNGRGLAFFAAITMIYISVFGQWKPSMQTLSLIHI